MQRSIVIVFLAVLALVQLSSSANADPVQAQIAEHPVGLTTGRVTAVRMLPEAYHRLVVVDGRPINLTELETMLPTQLAALGISIQNDRVTLPTDRARDEYAQSLQYLSDKVSAWTKQRLNKAAISERIQIWQRHRWHADGTNPYDGWRTAQLEIDQLDAAASTTPLPLDEPASSSSSANTSFAPLALAVFLIAGFALLCGRPSPVET